ncbi:MAG: TetR/AcrR family transcriptional regulator [Syntrophobacteraceae bacterium]|jgi:AcrR family transcriptional regulator
MHSGATNDVRETIIRESARLFLANGFRGTSVKEITEAAGIGRGTLYWYFKSKDDILEGVLRKFEKEFLEGVIEAVKEADGDFTEKFRVFNKYATEFARDNRNISLAFNTLLNEIVGTNTEAEKLAKAIWERYRLFFEGMLEDGKREGIVAQHIDAGLYAHIVVAAHTGMLMQWFIHGKNLDVRLFVKTFRDVLFSAIAVEK